MLIPVPAQLGYPVLAVLVFGESTGVPVPGETALITAGGLVADGHLSYPLVVLIATVAASLGDTLGYWVGRRKGREFLLRDGRFASHRQQAVVRADRYFARYGLITVFFQRWIPGVRIVGALCAGAARMPWARFAIANVLGALTWAAAVTALASAVGATNAFAFAAAGLAFGAITLLVVALRERRRRARVAASGRAAP
jgi:membrane protein DedA with SNARE-associated domain